jgi:hypothetical protein
MVRRRRVMGIAVDERDFHSLLKDIPQMSREQRQESEDVLEELQHAVEEHERILARQAKLIQRLREELKDVRK